MFDGDAASDTGRRDVAEFLATVPLLEGVPQAKLEELAMILRRRELPGGRDPVAPGRRGPGDAAARRRACLRLVAPARRSHGRGHHARAGRGARRGSAARRRSALGHRARGRADEPALAHPRGLRRPGLGAPSVRVRAQATHRGRRVLPAAPATHGPRGVPRRRRRRIRACRHRPSSSSAARRTARTCGASRRSAHSTRSRCGGS